MERKKLKRKGRPGGSEGPLFADPTVDFLERERMRTRAAQLDDLHYYSFGIHADGVGADARVEIELCWMCDAADYDAAAPRMAELLERWRGLDIVKEIEVEEQEDADDFGETRGENWYFEFTRPMLTGKPSFPLPRERG
jgi:hypothetical protein